MLVKPWFVDGPRGGRDTEVLLSCKSWVAMRSGKAVNVEDRGS